MGVAWSSVGEADASDKPNLRFGRNRTIASLRHRANPTMGLYLQRPAQGYPTARRRPSGRSPTPGSTVPGALRSVWAVAGNSVVVVGGGVCGLVAAHALARSGCAVTLLEAGDRVGGQVRSVMLPRGDDLPGTVRVVETGAEAVPLKAPGVAALVEELGLTSTMRSPRGGATLLSSRRGPVPLPAGVTPVGPTRFLPTVASRILPLRSLARAAAEPVTGRRKFDHDVSVGQFIRAHFGDEVALGIVDPLLGGIHAADIDRFSLAAAAPALTQAAADGDSLVLGTLARQGRRAADWARGLPGRGYRGLVRLVGLDAEVQPAAGGSASLASWPAGTVTLANRMASAVRASGSVLTRTRAVALSRDDAGPDGRSARNWLVDVEGPQGPARLAADAVVLAAPAAVSARLLDDVCPYAAGVLSAVRSASVATVVLDLPAGAVPAGHPISRAASWFIGSAWSPLVRQVINLSVKWPHTLSAAGRQVLRINVGRDGGADIDGLDDDALVARVLEELGRLGLDLRVGNNTGADRENPCTIVSRFPHAMPQPAPGHRDLMKSLTTTVSGIPGLAVGGCGTDGGGVGTAVAAGHRLARKILADAAHQDPESGVAAPDDEPID